MVHWTSIPASGMSRVAVADRMARCRAKRREMAPGSLWASDTEAGAALVEAAAAGAAAAAARPEGPCALV